MIACDQCQRDDPMIFAATDAQVTEGAVCELCGQVLIVLYAESDDDDDREAIAYRWRAATGFEVMDRSMQ